MRVRNSFDENWRFTRGDVNGAEQRGFDDSAWKMVNLPHDWSIEGPFSQDHPSGGGGGYLPGGIGWYRKTFELDYAGKTVCIEFDGVYKNCDAWINGHHLGFHLYGYTSFAYELTPYSLPGENVLTVRVDNSQQPDARWYTGSGIYRHTWLVITDPLHVAQWGTYVSTPTVSADNAMVSVRTRIRNDGSQEHTCKLLMEILDAEGHVAATREVSHPLASGQEHEDTEYMRVSQPHLWSLDDPYLYRVRSTLRIANDVIDEYETPLGIREICFDTERGFLLNGRQVKINGVTSDR